MITKEQALEALENLAWPQGAWRDSKTAIVRAYIEQAEPAGFVRVPVEPTPEMVNAALDCQDADPEDGPASEMYFAYRAMIKAAPKEPTK